MTKVALRGEDVNAGAVGDRGVVVPEIVRGQDRACAVALDGARGGESRESKTRCLSGFLMFSA